jgi:hypothetical protein
MAAPRPDLRIEALASHHDRGSFTCGVDSFDRYLRTQASQDVRRKTNGVFVLVKRDMPDTVLGYYRLCASGFAQGYVPVAARKHIPRYPLVSATLIRRLAVTELRHRQHLGSVLLADAVRGPTAARASSVRRCSSLTRQANVRPHSMKCSASRVCPTQCA